MNMSDNNEENVEKTVETNEELVNKTQNLKEEETVIVSEVSDETSETVAEEEVAVAEEVNQKEQKEEKKEKTAVIEYATLSLEELVVALQNTLSGNPVNKIKDQIEAIKGAFNVRFGTLLAEKKKIFLEEGGNVIDFQFTSAVKGTYNTLLSDYKKQRDAHYSAIDNQMHNNLDKRVQVIESLKNLIENADPNTMYKEFRVLQDTWRSIGAVSKTRYNDTWKTYHHHVERFYDLLHLSNDFRDLDFKNNLEEKLKIILKAEALAASPDVNEAFKELQELHKVWKEDIGPVAKEVREDVWQKFSAITKEIHDRRHNHFREMKSKFQEIITLKLAIIERFNAYDTTNNKTHKDWQNSIVETEKLRQEYFNAGKLPYAKSEEVWQKFKAATKKFNSSKNHFYKDEKSEQQENLKKKLALIVVAESLKESEDWEVATESMKKIQSDWKKIGHVPRKFSDDIWNKFKGACNSYFDRYHDQKNAVGKEQQATIDAKKAFLDALKEQTVDTKESVLEAIKTWKDLGQLPRNVRHLEGKFNKQIDRLLESLSLDKNEVSMLKFSFVIDGLMVNEDFRKLDSEQLFVRKKIDEIMKEIQQLENNLGFFSNAKDDNPLVLNVKNSVNEFKEDLSIWKEKLRYLKNLDY
jgi:hypothetical protein|tara:strand:+ start:13451 stop:15364 length:1914 start_codon:yes stop_codon:yes gene_type:complete